MSASRSAVLEALPLAAASIRLRQRQAALGPVARIYRTPRPSFREFIRDAWHLLEPATLFVDGIHVGAIAEHLQAISEGQLQNLIINIPPRHGKSSLVAVLWPAWEWIAHPEERWLFASYGQDLSTRDSLKRRRLIESDWYQERWGDRYTLTGDQNQKTNFSNNRTGVMLASSVGGQGTGVGGSRLVIDDPHKADDIESDAKRQAVLDWWDGTMSTRLDQPATAARVIVMQRLHERDLVGHILEKAADGGEQYDHLILPAEYEPTVQVCVVGLEHDQRTEPGQLLSPERFDQATIDRLKISLWHRAAGQLQQRPAPPGGAIFKVDDWWGEGRNRYDLAQQTDDPTKIVARWLSLDTAYKDTNTSDFTAQAVVELQADYHLRLREISNQRLEFHELLGFTTTQARRWNYDGKLQEVVFEDKGSGTSAIQTLRNGADPWLKTIIREFLPVGSKPYRYRQAAQWCALGCIQFPNPSDDAPWLYAFMERLKKVPVAEHDDDADAFAQIIIYLEHVIAEGFRARGGGIAA